MLKVENLSVHYGTIRALRSISFEVQAGEIISLIGANGSGKTTTLQAISGIVPKTGGKVSLDNEDISLFEPYQIVRKGMVQVPEGRRIFANLTVNENLEMGAYSRRDKRELTSSFNRVFESFPRLKERRRQIAGTLSGGEQQMLAIGRALMAKPRLLLLDEPSMGLAPVLVDEIFSIIKEINDAGVTILLVEQNAYKALSIASRVYILETGTIALQGPAQELASLEEVRKAYLGG